MSAVAGEKRRVLTIDIGGTNLTAGIVDANGDLHHGACEPTRAQEGADTVLARALELARGCHAAETEAGGEVDAIGVSTMGITHDRHVTLAPNVPGWKQLRIPAAVAAAFPGLPSAIGNDVHYAARAEITWGTLKGVRDGVYLNLGTGICAAIVAGGQLQEGAHGASGEVGYTLVEGRHSAPMAADDAAPFEEWYGGAGVARRLRDSGLPESVSELRERTDDPRIADFLVSLWDGIAVLAANLCIALDPAVLSVGGGYVRTASDVLDRIRALVERAVPFPPRVVRAHFGADASLRGAGAAALELIGDVR